MPVEFLYNIPRWLALGLVFLVGSGIFAATQVQDVWRETQWRAAEGQVTASREETRQCGRSQCQQLVVEYRYTVGGNTYTGQADAPSHANPPAAGAAVPVRYDPGNPTQSAVDAAAPGQHTLPLVIAGVGLLVGVVCLVKAAR